MCVGDERPASVVRLDIGRRVGDAVLVFRWLLFKAGSEVVLIRDHHVAPNRMVDFVEN